MSLYVLKLKTENKNITLEYMIGTGQNLKAVFKLKKATIKIPYVSFQGNL